MGAFEQGPQFEEAVPWDESVIPPKKREYLRKLHNDPKEVERFWSDEELGKKLKEKSFSEMIDMGFLAIEERLDHLVLGESDSDKGFNIRLRAFHQEIAALNASANPEGGPPFQQPEIFRQWFALVMKFMMEEGGAPQESFEIAPFIARAYELEAEHYRVRGIDPTKIYPFEEEWDIVMALGPHEKEQREVESPSEREIKSRGTPEELLEDEKELAEKGEEYLKGQAWPELRRRLLRFSEPGSKERRNAYKDFERWYQERRLRENRNKEIN